MKKSFNTIRTLCVFALAISLVSCFNKNSDSLTGWKSKEKSRAGFTSNKKYKGQQTPPGMVLVEGGSFTMGSVQDDVLFDWNTTPIKQQVRSFYIDETEVTNAEYLFYLEWIEKVFPKNEENYKYIYQSALPDTLVWRDVLGANELLTENYLRHPAYAEYPVVGVSWIQATQYCKWRTNIVNEKILIDKKVINSPYAQNTTTTVKGQNNFNTDTYLADPSAIFSGNNAIYTQRLYKGRQVKVSDGLLMPKFRLPTEVEWEYAAKAIIEDREYNNIRGRKKYAWKGKYTRNKSKRGKGDQLANFKQGKGDYSGAPGWSNDGSDIAIAVKSYSPNAFGLYDMSGNVAEWVADVYRPIIDNNANDFNYFRGNIFTKKMIGEDGKVVIIDDTSVEYDTLANGKIIPKALPGSVKYMPITKRDAYMRNNYEKSDNVDARDGDLASTKLYNKDAEELEKKPRMYNSPEKPENTEDFESITYDTKKRTTLISNQTRVYKGGSWKDRAYWLDPAQRRYLPEYMATNYIGFRCATDRFGAMSPTTKRRAIPKTKK